MRSRAAASDWPPSSSSSLDRPRPPASVPSWPGTRRRGWAYAGADRRSAGPPRRACARSPPGRSPPRAGAPRRRWARPRRPRRNGAGPLASRSRSPGSCGTTSTLGRPIAAFSVAGVPSATILPRSMMPTRSASTSASSRYCVVRNTVTPSPARRRTSSHSAARLCGSRPVVGSSRNSSRGRCTSASPRSSLRFIPPE